MSDAIWCRSSELIQIYFLCSHSCVLRSKWNYWFFTLINFIFFFSISLSNPFVWIDFFHLELIVTLRKLIILIFFKLILKLNNSFFLKILKRIFSLFSMHIFLLVRVCIFFFGFIKNALRKTGVSFLFHSR